MRHNLPAEPNRFVGRERDLDELCRLAGETRVLTLSGVGGIGKTRAALQVAARLVTGFADGAWLVELARLTRAELVAHEVASVLGVHEESGRPLLDTVRDHLRTRRLLLLLDNCEHLVAACAELAGTLLAACPGLRICATSREPLKIPGELVWRVPPLDLPEAGRIGESESVRLFLDRAVAAGSGLTLTDENASAVAGLCHALDGVPLALELAAARTSMLSPQQIAGRIGDRFQLLTAGDRTAPARQRTLLATVEWSHDLLDDAERLLLRRLSVFAGQFDIDLAEGVCADPPVPVERVLDLLGGLVDKSLVVAERQGDGAVRYRLLETIRQFAGDRLAEARERDAMRDRHLEVLCDLVEARHALGMVAPRTPWEARFAAYRQVMGLTDDVRAALGWAVDAGRAERGLRLACAMMSIWVSQGSFIEGLNWYGRLLALDAPDLPPELVGRARARLGDMAFGRDDLPAAWDAARSGLAAQRSGPPGWELGATLNFLAMLGLRTGRLDEAVAYSTEALDGARASGDLWNEATALAGLAAAAALRGRWREAQRLGEEGLANFRETRHNWGIARALVDLGLLAQFRGDFDAAYENLRASLPMLREMDATPELSRCLAGLGRIEAQRQNLDAAREWLAQSLELSRQTGQQLAMARALAALSTLAETAGDLERAVTLAGAVTTVRESIGQRGSASRVEELLSRARERFGAPRTALLWTMGREMDVEEAIRHAAGQGAAPQAAGTTRPSAGPLTAREREIVAMLAQGLSNKAIAEELVISPATVARHVANILVKLGFTSRTQVAAWAAEHGIF